MTARIEKKETRPVEFVHTGLVSHSLHGLTALVVPMVRAAVSGGDRVLVALGEDEEKALRTGLSPPLRQDVEFLSRSSFYSTPGRTLAALRRLANSAPGRRLTVVGQPPLPEEDPLALREWRLLDSVLNMALARHPIQLLCVHDARRLSGPVRDGVWHTHPTVITDNGRRPGLRYRDPEELGAEVAAHPLPPPQEPVHRVRISADLPAVRDEVARLADRLEVPGVLANDLVVAVNELVANVLEHGAGKGAVTLWRQDGRIVCDVFDEAGQLTDPLSGYRTSNELSTRGYGLWITRQMCDFMEVRGGTEGSLVRMHFRL
ncbi:sensor histidine kinase [Thermobifida halotolerans]|uniref:Sensor histidine kinase n=1 Tax=Thermobifida halotolerans TaxID=483545 RepID=A0AA97LWB5_9ACTN|nr:sensor histidine kinase [Thermobifida halotolerans]UOE19362.1 sensor histidine kinase [Thermobifida halotolerans]